MPLCWEAITAFSTLVSALVIFITGFFLFYQLREMKKATIAQAFSSIATMLDDDRVRNARYTLMSISQNDFTKWTEKEIDNAAKACSTFDTVGIMVSNGIIDHKMVTREWRYSIIECWEHAQPMIAAYRKQRGKDFWDDFEGLYNKAKLISV